MYTVKCYTYALGVCFLLNSPFWGVGAEGEGTRGGGREGKTGKERKMMGSKISYLNILYVTE